MEGRLSAPGVALVGCMIFTVGACTLPAKVDQKAQDAAERERAHRATQDAIDKEKVPVGNTARPSHGTRTLRAGESVWMQSGKSTVLHVPYAVTRVSIGNPDLAGVVVLSPHTILVNAKDVPKEGDEGGGGQARAGVLTSRTFTPPPHMAETTVILWDGKNNTDSHTLFVTDFLAEQVLLEVTIAELNRTKMEARGIDFQSLRTNPRVGYWLGGGPLPQLTNIQPTITTPGASGGFIGDIPFPIAVGGAENPTFVLQSKDADIAALVTMLQTEGLAPVLAQPKLMALSGQNAVFQVGG